MAYLRNSWNILDSIVIIVFIFCLMPLELIHWSCVLIELTRSQVAKKSQIIEGAASIAYGQQKWLLEGFSLLFVLDFPHFNRHYPVLWFGFVDNRHFDVF
jgi:hypothetical protein